MNYREISACDFKELLGGWDFVKAGHIQLEANRTRELALRFILDPPSKPHLGSVYLWVENVGQMHNIVYVGKAGKTLNARCAQHTAGFRKSPTGRGHAQRIEAGLKDGRTYSLYARESASTVVCGETVSLVGIEEAAFIKKFEPPWNKTDRQRKF